MSELHRRLAQGLLIVVAVAIAFAVTPAGDREFNLIAHELEMHSQGRRSVTRFLGVANLLAPITRPAAFRRIRIAAFDSPSLRELAETNLAETIRGALNPDWRPLLRHQVRRTGEQTHVYFRSSGNTQQLMIVEVRSSEAVLIQATLEPEQFARYLARPDEMGRQIETDLPGPVER